MATKRRRIVHPGEKQAAIGETTEARGHSGAGEDGVVESAVVQVRSLPGEATEAITPNTSVDMTLVMNFTHQIINPLNGVVGTLDNMIDGTLSPDKHHQRILASKALLEVVIELVRNLAYLSELSTSAGKEAVMVGATRLSLPKIIVEAAQTLQDHATQKKITISLTEQDTQYMVRGQKALLRQMYLNLIENGIKYGDDGSRIVLRNHVQKRTGILISEVLSTGVTIPADECDLIFQRGYRASTAKEKMAGGSGIGLFICREIIELHGASIEATSSQLNRTTTFVIRFPHFEIDTDETKKVASERKRRRTAG